MPYYFSLVLTHIIKETTLPTTNRIKRPLEILSEYPFNLYYVKGNMILSNFLFILNHDTSDPDEIINISCNMQEVLHTKY